MSHMFFFHPFSLDNSVAAHIIYKWKNLNRTVVRESRFCAVDIDSVGKSLAEILKWIDDFVEGKHGSMVGRCG